MEILLITAVVAERDACLASFDSAGASVGPYEAQVALSPAGTITAVAGGVGPSAVASSIVAADLGAWAPDGFLDFSAIGLDGTGGITPPAPWVAELTARLKAADVPALSGPVLTLSAMTGTDARADELFARHGAVAEAMEAAGMAEAATRFSVPVMEVRTMSNLVGDRDREVWQLEPALLRLAEISRIIFGAAWPEL